MTDRIDVMMHHKWVILTMFDIRLMQNICQNVKLEYFES